MNVNDSEKVAGLLRPTAYERPTTPRDADFVFINTCAVREKAAEKLFHSLGRLRHQKAEEPGPRDRRGRLRGPARRPGDPRPRAVRRRARGHAQRRPRAGAPATRRARPPGGSTSTARRTRSPCPTTTSRTRAPCGPTSPRWRAATTSAASAWCRARAGPRSTGRPSASSREVREPRGARLSRGDAARPDGERLPARGRRLRRPARARARGPRPAAAALHDLAPGARRRAHGGGVPRPAQALPLPAPARPVGLRPHPRSECAAATRAPTTSRRSALLRDRRPGPRSDQRRHRRLPGRDEADFQATVDLVDAVGFDGLFVFTLFAAAGHDRAAPDGRRARRGEAPPAAGPERRQQRASGAGTTPRGRTRRGGPGRHGGAKRAASPGRTPHFRIVHLDGAAELLGRTSRSRSWRPGPTR